MFACSVNLREVEGCFLGLGSTSGSKFEIFLKKLWDAIFFKYLRSGDFG
jgi:hypothetical protein